MSIPLATAAMRRLAPAGHGCLVIVRDVVDEAGEVVVDEDGFAEVIVEGITSEVPDGTMTTASPRVLSRSERGRYAFGAPLMRNAHDRAYEHRDMVVGDTAARLVHAIEAELATR